MAMFEIHTVDEQIKSLPIIDTASGSVATFDTDMTENLVEVKCQIVAQQGGSGTPSPDNKRPIITFDHCSVFHNSINIWNERWEVGGISWYTGENEASTTRFRSTDYISVRPNGKYFLKAKSGDTIGTRYYDINYNYLYGETPSPNTEFIVPNNVYFLRFINVTTATYNNDISINYPSTETNYEPFSGANIPFGQTVANGVLDVTTGKLRVTQAVKVFNGSENWYLHADNTNNNVFVLQDAVASVLDENNQISNLFIFNSQAFAPNDDVENTFVLGSSKRLFCQVAKTTAINATAFATLLNNNNLKVVYNIAPQEIQLDSTQIQALLNENNVWCDTGDTEVKYLLTLGRVS